MIPTVLGLAGCAGLVTSSKDAANPPTPTAATITAQPTSQQVTAGQTATFSVVATGTAPMSYQWQKNGATITGAASASYTTPPTTNTDNGSTFRAMVSDPSDELEIVRTSTPLLQESVLASVAPEVHTRGAMALLISLAKLRCC